jgi:hypothetical protein
MAIMLSILLKQTSNHFLILRMPFFAAALKKSTLVLVSSKVTFLASLKASCAAWNETPYYYQYFKGYTITVVALAV